MAGFSKYEFNKKVLSGVTLLRVALGITWVRSFESKIPREFHYTLTTRLALWHLYNLNRWLLQIKSLKFVWFKHMIRMMLIWVKVICK